MNRPLRKILAAAIGFALSPLADAADDPPKTFSAEDVQEACDRAGKYLLSQQWGSGCIQGGGDRGKRKHDERRPPRHSVTMSSLAVMGLAAIGHTPSDPTDEGKAMRAALDFVLRPQHQDDEGYFGRIDNSRMYGHGIITLMLAEMLGMGADEEMDRTIRDRCQKAINLIVRSQKAREGRGSNKGGWRYEPDSSDSDLSVTVWQLMALRAAKNGGLEVPKKVIDDAITYVKGTFNKREGAFGYTAGGGHILFSTAAEGLLSMQVCGEYDADEVIKAADYLLKRDPQKESQWFYYGLYYYAQGMAQRGGEHASTAKQSTSRTLLKLQDKDGSWRPRGGNEHEGGKIYATSMALLSLSIHHNFLPIYQR